MACMLSLVLLEEGLGERNGIGGDMDNHGNLMQGHQVAYVLDSRPMTFFSSK